MVTLQTFLAISRDVKTYYSVYKAKSQLIWNQTDEFSCKFCHKRDMIRFSRLEHVKVLHNCQPKRANISKSSQLEHNIHAVRSQVSHLIIFYLLLQIASIILATTHPYQQQHHQLLLLPHHHYHQHQTHVSHHHTHSPPTP